MLLQPTLQPDAATKQRNGTIRRLPEKIHARYKKQGVNDARHQDPFPQTVLPDKAVRLGKRLDGYDDFFKQTWGLVGKYIEIGFAKATFTGMHQRGTAFGIEPYNNYGI